MNLGNLEKIFEAEPKYRIKQAKAAIFQELIEDWSQASAFPLDWREKLNEKLPLTIKAEILVSKTNDSVKARLTLEDGLKIEAVLLRHNDGRNTICVSSQVGCALACDFCATGQMGFKRNLEVSEIIEQVIFFARHLKKENKKISNIVFMGMGEPFLNYENVMTAIKSLNDKDYFGIGARNISISTVGITEGIEKLAEEKIQLNLAISLHAPNNELREKIMPINKKYPIEAILKSVDDYIKKTNRQVMFEYLLIDKVNDTDSCVMELTKLMGKPLYFLNLITYNPTGIFQPSIPSRIEKFKAILRKSGVKFSQRYKFGQDIEAACGQFAVKHQISDE